MILISEVHNLDIRRCPMDDEQRETHQHTAFAALEWLKEQVREG